MPEISIILPVYNVAPYIERCVGSIWEQVFRDFELIVVDDASTDDSVSVLTKVLEGYHGLDWTLISHPRNRGLSAARNSGIQAARGNYLYFPDSDDYLEPELLSFTYHKLLQAGSDIVVFGLRTVYENPGRNGVEDVPDMEADLNGREALFALLNGACRTYICTQLFRRELFESIRFPEGHVYEDRFTLPYLFLASANVSFVRSVFYNYMQRSGSITKSFRPEMIQNVARIEKVVQDIRDRFGGKDWKKAVLRFKYQNIYSIILVAMLRGGTYATARPIWRESRRAMRPLEWRFCFSTMRNPVVALSVFTVSPRLFWILFRRYYQRRHEI